VFERSEATGAARREALIAAKADFRNDIAFSPFHLPEMCGDPASALAQQLPVALRYSPQSAPRLIAPELKKAILC
jgi:hypothetical protein